MNNTRISVLPYEGIYWKLLHWPRQISPDWCGIFLDQGPLQRAGQTAPKTSVSTSYLVVEPVYTA
jgi:hypothetical protein